MKTYDVDGKKRKKALKRIVKVNIKDSKGFVKFCYGLTWFLRTLAVALGIANIIYVMFFSNHFVEIIFLIMTFGFPYGLSYLSAIVYIISAGGEYRLRRRETITLANDGFVYGYHDDRVGLSDAVFGFNVSYNKIEKYEYDEGTKLLTLYGTIVGNTYENGEFKNSDEYNQISMLDVYDISINKLLTENC